MNYRFLVVGGTGFLGQHVVAELLDRGHHATVLARGTARPASPVEVLTGDALALGRAEWAGLLDGYDGVVFAAEWYRALPPPPSSAGATWHRSRR